MTFGMKVGRVLDTYKYVGEAGRTPSRATMGKAVVGGVIALAILLCGAIAVFTGWPIGRNSNTTQKLGADSVIVHDEALDELRTRVAIDPEDGVVRERLAVGLLKAFNSSKAGSDRADN
jgi:hypothetical protein